MGRKYFYIIAGSAFVVIAVVFLVFKNDNGEKLVQLKANVVYFDKKITITNDDTLDFIHTDISIDKYYKLRDFNLQAGETYNVSQIEFSHKNGKHYPEKLKPSQFSIWCEIYDGRNGFYSKEFK